ncbi:MAG TPA: hypothetical protein VFW71_11885 [Actinomycetota bacterium]|nr:hypothetical protein [Actinomycetota bacterium]
MQEGTSTAVVVTWDEGEGGKVNDSATNTNTTDIGCHVVTIKTGASDLIPASPTRPQG